MSTRVQQELKQDRDTPSEHRAAIVAWKLARDKGGVTVADLAKEAGIDKQVAGKKLRAMRDAGLFGVKGKRKTGRTVSTVYGFGPDEIDGPARKQPGARMIAFKSLMEALQHSSSVTDLVEETGIGRRTVQIFLKVARAWRIAYISAWTPPIGSGPWVARWKVGLNADMKQPQGQPRNVINARYWAKRAERIRAQRIHEALTLPLAA